jgi:xanthosine utilization system XapX-like protein
MVGSPLKGVAKGGRMRGRPLAGLAAGAIGTIALDITTYLDILVRARGSSDLPARVAGALAERIGVDLGGGDGSAEAAENRKSALGALLGYGVGVGVGAVYGLLRPAIPRVPAATAGIGLGLAAMAASDLPPTVLGLTDPRTWGAAGWASDVVPHVVYGLVTALAFDAIAGRRD